MIDFLNFVFASPLCYVGVVIPFLAVLLTLDSMVGNIAKAIQGRRS